MHTAIAIFDTDYSVPIEELARAAEERGFESLWVAEHSHIPTNETRWPGGQELPKHYWHTLDPFVALTIAAQASKTLSAHPSAPPDTRRRSPRATPRRPPCRAARRAA